MRKICCFAGHSKIYGDDDLYERLTSVIRELIQTEGVTEFWVGNYGGFDSLAAKAVKELKGNYSDVRLCLVIPYLTRVISEYKEQYRSTYDDIIIADIPATTPKSLMIIKANQYMVKNARVLVCYVKYSFGGAAKTLEYARKRDNIRVINLDVRI